MLLYDGSDPAWRGHCCFQVVVLAFDDNIEVMRERLESTGKAPHLMYVFQMLVSVVQEDVLKVRLSMLFSPPMHSVLTAGPNKGPVEN